MVVWPFAAPHERVAVRDDDDHLLVAEVEDRAVPFFGVDAQRDVGFTRQHLRRDEVRVGVLVHTHLDAGMRGEPFAKGVGEDAEREREARRDAELALVETRRGARGSSGIRRCDERRLRARQHRASDRGQRDAARAALEQRRADGRLEDTELMRERGLRDVQTLGGAGDRARLRDDREVLELPETERDLVCHRENLWQRCTTCLCVDGSGGRDSFA